MGKFLRDPEGGLVSVGGAPVLEKFLDRKPPNCQTCGFGRWAKGDKLFILAGNQWVCPDCAVAQGLPSQYYHRNAFAIKDPPTKTFSRTKPSRAGNTTSPATNTSNSGRRQSRLGECVAFMCYF